MKLEFTKEGLLPEEILERIRGRPTKYGWEPPKSPGEIPDKLAADGQADAGQAPEYYFEVEGFAPELMSGVAFRLSKHYKTRGKKEIKCPHCTRDFRSVDVSVKVKLFSNPRKEHIPYCKIKYCKHCHQEVGVILVSA